MNFVAQGLFAMEHVKLKSVPKIAEKNNLKNDVLEEQILQNRLRDVDLESWYSNLEKFTFRTVTVSFSPEEGKQIISNYYNNLKNNSDLKKSSLSDLTLRIADAMKG
jgi:hypothetical protein